MKWNRRNILALSFLLVLGFGSCTTIYFSEEGGVSFAVFRIKKWVNGFNGSRSPRLSPSLIASSKMKADAVLLRELARYPALQIKPKQVPDSENGFLGILIIKSDPRLHDLQKSNITEKLDQSVINADEVERDLEIYREIGAEIERIASLPERSTENLPIPFEWLLPSVDFKIMSDYLLLKARLASIRKDEREAFRYIEMASNLGEHLNGIEKPSFMSETVLVLTRLALRGVVMNQILPELGQEVDLNKWRHLLEPRIANGDRLSSLIITELYFFHHEFSYLLFTGGTDAVPDPEAFCKAYVACTEAVVKQYRGVDFLDLPKVKLPSLKLFDKNLSRESLEMENVMSFGSRSWIKGFVRSAVVETQTDAALDLLIREKAGEDLSKLTETYVHNPFTGKPFAYDPTGRVIPAVPEADGGANELKLPW